MLVHLQTSLLSRFRLKTLNTAEKEKYRSCGPRIDSGAVFL
jgi:hypothetical protein